MSGQFVSGKNVKDLSNVDNDEKALIQKVMDKHGVTVKQLSLHGTYVADGYVNVRTSAGFNFRYSEKEAGAI